MLWSLYILDGTKVTRTPGQVCLASEDSGEAISSLSFFVSTSSRDRPGLDRPYVGKKVTGNTGPFLFLTDQGEGQGVGERRKPRATARLYRPAFSQPLLR
jgi:hypothetical protein